jgi:hypothetical protein
VRENPWHQPAPHSEHEQRFRNLISLHGLTASWLRDLDLDAAGTAHLLKRVAAPEVRSHLRKLEQITRGSAGNGAGSAPRLADLIDASTPDEFLRSFEYAVWALQAWTLRNVLDRTSPGELPALRSLIEQSSWKEGRSASALRWPSMPVEAASDARGLLAALRDSPLAGYPEGRALLTRRCTASGADLELLACPHVSPFPEVKAVQDDLCASHAAWMRGFLYGLNPSMVLEHLPKRRGVARCAVKFGFHSHSLRSSFL